MKILQKLVFVIFLLGYVSFVNATDNLLMVRTERPFEVAMEKIKGLIEEYGYTVAHTQRCDGGLNDFGYETDYYRVIFFGKYEEVHALGGQYPEIIPFLPLKFLVFAENDETVIVSLNPHILADYFENSDLKNQLKRWRNDINEMFSEMHN
jgi:uncharacterized protein (DUF302 family)